MEERPLAKKQEELDEQELKEEDQNQSCDTIKPDEKGPKMAEIKAEAALQSAPHKHPVKPLLRNDDYELLRVKSVRAHILSISVQLTYFLDFSYWIKFTKTSTMPMTSHKP